MSLIFACLAAIAVDGDTFVCRDPQAPGGGPPPALASGLTGRRAVALAALRADLEKVNGRVRIARIDAPERGRDGAAEAKAALARLIDGRKVTCELVDADPRVKGFQARDRFGRPVARCSAGGVDLGAALIRAGYAVSWPKKR